MTNAVAVQTRLPLPANVEEMDARKWKVLVESVFPNAKTTEAVVMALDYCKARKLDIFKRPVNIVPMWNKSLGREVETVWPGINEVQTTAARTGKYAGMDEPKWGPDIQRTFKNGSCPDVTVTFPEWCSVTVYRIVDGQRCAFTEPVFWIEAYAHGKTEAPNSMWAKRPRGQVLKVAKAFSLRAAFPEEGEYVAEEMEGKEIEAGGVVIENKPDTKPYDVDASKPATPFKTAALRNQFQANVADSLNKALKVEELNTIITLNKEKLDLMRSSGDERDQMSVESIQNIYRQVLSRLAAPKDSEAEPEDFDPRTGEVAGALSEDEKRMNDDMNRLVS